MTIDLTHLKCPEVYFESLELFRNLNKDEKLEIILNHLETVVEVTYILCNNGAKYISRTMIDGKHHIIFSKS